MNRFTYALRVLLPMLFVLAGTGTALARHEAKTIRAHRAKSPLVIDGVLDEPCWALAEVGTDFVDYRTERLAREQTFVRVLYDDTYIYFGFECLEPEPAKIVAVERKHGQSLVGEDRIEIRLDTFHDLRHAYVFVVNTLGTRYDARQGLFQFDDSWTCDWKAACTVVEDRWFAEVAIPIASLLFDRKDEAVWGGNFRRVEYGLQENSYWCYRNSQARLPREFGTITALDLANVQVERRPVFETYVSSTYDIDSGRADFSTGADISLRLSPELTSAFTINPDFGHVEADPDTIELRDTERLLRERRPFFREGSELFDTPVNIYYSRRFQKIDAGGKLTGQGRHWGLGLIDVQGEIRRDGEMRSGNYHVGRFIHDVGEFSHVGAIWTTAFRENGNNITGGVDSRVFFDSTTSLTAQILGLTDSEGIASSEAVDKNAYAAYLSLTGGTQPLWWGVNYRDISRGFRPDLGYVPRRDIRGPGSFLSYRQNLDGDHLKWISARVEARIYENHHCKTTLRDFTESVGFCLRNEIDMRYTRADLFRAPYQNWYDRFVVGYNREVDIWNSVSAGLERGRYQREPYVAYSLEKPQRITDRLVTTLGGDYRNWTDRQQNEIAWLWRSVTQYNFSWDARVKFTAEKTSEGRHNLTMLFSWLARKEIDLYVLWNNYETNGEDVSSVFVKVVYHF